jgi:cytochrome c556
MTDGIRMRNKGEKMTKKKIKKPTAKKTVKKTVKKTAKKIIEQKKLIRAIKTPERFFKVEFSRYGGEVAMGEITEAQFNHWNDNEKFEEYIGKIGYDADEANQDVPEEARLRGEFYEYGDICHQSGPELADGQMMHITEVDKEGDYLRDDGGDFLPVQEIDMKDFKRVGVKVCCADEHHSASDSCKDKYYIFGQYLNKGGWYTQVIQTGPEGFDLKKTEINYENADGFKVFSEIVYDGEAHYLEEDSTGKGSSFYVMEGDDV